MTFARLLLLMMVTSIFFLMIGVWTGTAQTFAIAAFAAGSFVIYFSPAMIAQSRGHPSTMAIFILNLLLGWIVLGWIVALVWSHTGHAAREAEDELEDGDDDFVRCPFCAEDIRVDAILCRHCGSMLHSVGAEHA